MRHRVALLALALAPALHARAASAQDAPRETRRVAGRVLTPADSGMRGVGNAWVVLHRIGTDSAGPVDSVRTAADGRYAFTYRTAPDDSAAWTTSSMHAGIAHFSQTFDAPDVAGEASEIVVFDTTSAPVGLHVRGRHVVVYAAEPGAARDVMEVYEIENDGALTAVARGDSQPVWSAPLPARATAPRLTEGAVSPDAVTFGGGRVRLFAPFTPGLQQIAFRYGLPAGAFPLELTLHEEAEFLEVLLEDPLARVSAPGLEEVESVVTEGRRLRRFLARHADSGTVVRVDVPTPATGRRGPAVALVVSLAAVAMGGALVVALRRPRHGAVRELAATDRPG